MANDANPGLIPAISLVHGSQAATKVTSESSSGKSLPSGGHGAAAPAASASKSTAGSRTHDVQAQVAFLNKFLNDSGTPNQFRVAPDSNSAADPGDQSRERGRDRRLSGDRLSGAGQEPRISSALIDEHA